MLLLNGSGENGFSDEVDLETLHPLNLYGHSKQNFDLGAQGPGALDRIVGLKYFNVFGPSEYHKKEMQSMVRRGYLQVLDSGKIRLFKSYNPKYADGEQERDFLYVKDAVEMTLFFLDNPKIGGIFNAGMGWPEPGMSLQQPCPKPWTERSRSNTSICPLQYVTSFSTELVQK